MWKTEETEIGLIDRDNSQNVDTGDFKNVARGKIYKGEHILCYIESEDGISWKRPELCEFFYKTKNGEIIPTNIVFCGSHGHGVNKNTHPEAGKKEPAFLLAGRCEETEDYGVSVATSEDGIHWSAPVCVKKGDKSTRTLWADTHNQIFWSPESEEYVVITRSFDDDGCRVVTRMDENGALKTVIAGREDAQPYSVPVTRIADGYYLGIVSVADFDDNSDTYMQVHTELVWSRDTKEWKYISKGKPFIANDKSFAFEKGNSYGMVYASALALAENSFEFFYAALPELHYFSFEQIPENIKEEMKKEIPQAVARTSITRSPALMRAKLGKDRFAGIYSKDGKVTTKNFNICGESIFLTADVSPGGYIKATLFGETGEIAGTYISENCTDAKIFEVSDVDVHIEFEIKDATLYTITN